MITRLIPMALAAVVLLGPQGALGAPRAGSGHVSAFAANLIDKAREATLARRIPLAATLLGGAWEISRSHEALRWLARVHAMAGQFDDAVEKYQLLLKLAPPPEVAKVARAEIKRLREAPSTFGDELPARARATEEAKQAFSRGIALQRQKKLEEAIRYLRGALVLDPDLPGTYRVLGAIYGKLKQAEQERDFLEQYLRVRPDGRIADEVRKRLAPAGSLAHLALASSFECAVWIDGRAVGRSTPLADLQMPSGTYTVSFVNAEYHIIRNFRVRLRSREKKSLQFEFGVLALRLNPWARARANGKDLGLWNEIGLPAGAYDLALEAFDASKAKTVRVSIMAGKVTSIVSW